MPDGRIVIIGAGPTGLGAAYRLHELGYRDFVVLEAADHVGGLAASERTQRGFTYDIGGHVLFSHYEYFDRLFERLMGGEYQTLRRDASIWMHGRFLPYPFQNNLRHLPKDIVYECVAGLLDAQQAAPRPEPFANFEELIYGTFGAGIARHFMVPYNWKVWAHPATMMSTQWIGERVSVVDLRRVLRNVIVGDDDVAWGPNATFKYPRYGGTGGLFARMEPPIRHHLRLATPAAAVDLDAAAVILPDGSREPYDVLLSTMPLDLLVRQLQGEVPTAITDAARQLRHSGSYIVGVGLAQPCPSRKCWIYFPESDCPFYRLTYLSNYSPDVVPDPTSHYSLLAEISYSEFKPVCRRTVVADTIQGLMNTGILRPGDADAIVDTHLIERSYTYPTPSLERDAALRVLHPYLESRGIYSRGRFGAWRYEVGNMDHSVAQGVEWVERILCNRVSDELTYQGKRGC